MKLRDRLSRYLLGRTSALLAAGLVLGLGLAAPSDSLAGPGRGHRKHHKVHKHHPRHAPAWGAGVVYRPVPAPRVIVAGPPAAPFRSYYAGTTYYRAHRHHHRVYSFPVRVEGGWVVRPHHYCDGHLFGRFHLGVRGDGFSVSLGW